MTPLFRSATLKLTIWYLLIVMSISLGFSAAIFKIGHDELVYSLHDQRAHIYQTYPVFTDDPFFRLDIDVSSGTRHILINLLYLNAFVFVVAGFASYWLARRTLEPIEAANLQQKHFVTDASHELRTPLTALKMETEVALMDEAASKTDLRQALTSNLEEANKLEALIDNLLKLSRLEETSALTLIPLDMKTLATEAVARVSAAAKAKHIAIADTVPARLQVMGDPDSLVQMLVILLDNAVKYSSERSKVTVSAQRHDNDVLLRIEDHGHGISRQALEHVFDRFYRADTSRQTNGYGLGLAIAKRIADLHHAALTLTSTEGKGTTATIRLSAVDSSVSPGDTA